jgi:mannitol/fructose-specific phosphotransferase system IIA component (Ntr-type)
MKPFYEKLPARNYYGPHATGSVILRNGVVMMHGKTKDVNKAYKECTKQEVFVVVTTTTSGDDTDAFADVVLITEDKEKAEKLVAELCKSKRKYKNLCPYEDAAYFTRNLEDMSIWK